MEIADLCDLALSSRGSCALMGYRAGAMLGHEVANRARWEPWLRLGIACEWLRFTGELPLLSTDPSVARHNAEFAYALRGWLFQSRVGADYALSRSARLGAFLSFDAGRYSRFDFDDDATSPELPARSADFEQRATHYWLGAGARAAFIGP